MATIPEAVSASHFDIIFTHWEETLTLNRYSGETTNITGQISDDSYGKDESITGILNKSRQTFTFEKEGFVEQGDAYLMLKYADHSDNPPSKHDKITKSDGQEFLIDNVLNRRDLYYFCRLYKVG